MKIIIVDDEVLVRKGITMSIDWEKIGINHVFEASNGEQALEEILSNDIDIVLTDINMPKMDGLELIEELKVVKPNVVVIVLSCINDMKYVRKALKFGGAIDYIPKLSMTTQELENIINRAKDYVVSKKEIDLTLQSTNLPLFFKSEYERRLRKCMEYGTIEDIEALIEEIFKEADSLGGYWRKSREWYDIISVLSSIIKKYNVSIENFSPQNIMIEHMVNQSKEIEHLKRYILEISINIKEFILKKQKVDYDQNINKAVYYINNNYHTNIKLADVANHVNISEAYLSRMFKKVMGISFVDYINSVRVGKAKELLETKRFTIEEVADQIGYSNPSYFTQVFRGIEGITPKQYQKKQYNNR